METVCGMHSQKFFLGGGHLLLVMPEYIFIIKIILEVQKKKRIKPKIWGQRLRAGKWFLGRGHWA